MIFDLEPIFAGAGAALAVDYSMDLSAVELDSVFPFTQPVRVVGAFRNRAGVVQVDATASFTLELFCDRCASPMRRSFDVPVQHVLVRELNDESNDELICIDSVRFELDDLVSDDIFLSLPTKFLCREDCRGLCPQCGQNLNEGSCSCKKAVDPRLEGLLQFLDHT